MRSYGFSLIDFMITLAVLALLLSFGVPSAGQLIEDQRLSGLKAELITQLNLARSTAVHQSQQINLCPSPDGEHCAQHGDWSQGWIVFADQNHDQQHSADEALIQVAAAQTWASITSGQREQIRFRFDGTAVGSNASLRLCDQRGALYGWRLVVSNLGRVRSEGPGIDHC